jgi:hypothetical protein
MAPYRSLITMANEQVSIVYACALAGVEVPEGVTGRGYKTFCPFGEVWHSDQNAERAFVVYQDSNSAFCFACSTYFTPVYLVAKAWDRSLYDTAVELLDRVGYKPVSMAQAWANAATKEVVVDVTNLGLALRTYCSGVVSDWDSVQFDPVVAHTLDQCLALLARVKTEDEATQWLHTTKQVMTSALRKDG